MTVSTIRNIAATALVAVAVFFVYRFFNPPEVAIEVVRDRSAVSEIPAPTNEEVAANPNTDQLSSSESVADVVVEPDGLPAPDAEFVPVDEAVATVALGTWDDAEIERLTDLLNSDPAFAEAVMQEFRSEADPQRLKRLANLLGELDDPALVPLAEEMLYSGNVESQQAGFLLLNKVQSKDPAARDVAMRVLSGESDPGTLVSAINILARPADIDDEQRTDILNHITPLIGHDDPMVRRRSYSTLARISDPGEATDTLLAGLNDSDPKVRQSITYSFITNAVDDQAVIYTLLSVAENVQEAPITRQGALQALRQLTLSTDEEARVNAVAGSLNQ
ncbi:MAG: HEAT repeat domain-containing protein [Gammaproteobacteria bacterium]|nr:HEAT repeat domain-containing protein [Gammaproteobacteria bacterium]